MSRTRGSGQFLVACACWMVAVSAVAGQDLQAWTCPGSPLTLRTEGEPVEGARSTDTWPMFQGNPAHTGYLPVALDPQAFTLRWQRDIGGDLALNPVTGGDGRVFVTLLDPPAGIPTLFAVDASDGSTIWSKTYGEFGAIHIVNPPSYAFGRVYVQTDRFNWDSWLRAYEPSSGTVIFEERFSTDGQHHFAPTIFNDSVYFHAGQVNSAMWRHDAHTGFHQWAAPLSTTEYENWTPAVSGERLYGYVGSPTPGLHVRHAISAQPVSYFPDPGFQMAGLSLNLAPVIGSYHNVLVIQAGRLLSFNTSQGNLVELPGDFTGQPSVAAGIIYAVKEGRLVALNERRLCQRWSWQAPEGPVVGPMIVTDTHVILSTAQNVHAVDLSTHESVWSYPVSGHLAMANGALYVAGADGVLTAIAAPSVPEAREGKASGR